jgi:hypothetical protein
MLKSLVHITSTVFWWFKKSVIRFLASAMVKQRSLLFWDVMCYMWHLRIVYWSHLRSNRLLKMGLTGYAATSATNYQPTLYQIPEEDLWKTAVWQQINANRNFYTGSPSTGVWTKLIWNYGYVVIWTYCMKNGIMECSNTRVCSS